MIQIDLEGYIQNYKLEDQEDQEIPLILFPWSAHSLRSDNADELESKNLYAEHWILHKYLCMQTNGSK